MDEADLKEFIKLTFENVLKELNRLSAVIERQDSLIRTIEITSTTRIAEIQKDINNAFEEIEALKHWNQDRLYSIEKEEGARQASDITILSKLEAFTVEQNHRWEDQAKINGGIGTLTKLLWVILGIVLSILIGFIWSLIVNGGIQGLLGK